MMSFIRPTRGASSSSSSVGANCTVEQPAERAAYGAPKISFTWTEVRNSLQLASALSACPLLRGQPTGPEHLLPDIAGAGSWAQALARSSSPFPFTPQPPAIADAAGLPLATYPGSFAARRSTFSILGGTASNSPALAISAAAMGPSR
jgi:hypothetical protein